MQCCKIYQSRWQLVGRICAKCGSSTMFLMFPTLDSEDNLPFRRFWGRFECCKHQEAKERWLCSPNRWYFFWAPFMDVKKILRIFGASPSLRLSCVKYRKAKGLPSLSLVFCAGLIFNLFLHSCQPGRHKMQISCWPWTDHPVRPIDPELMPRCLKGGTYTLTKNLRGAINLCAKAWNKTLPAAMLVKVKTNLVYTSNCNWAYW